MSYFQSGRFTNWDTKAAEFHSILFSLLYSGRRQRRKQLDPILRRSSRWSGHFGFRLGRTGNDSGSRNHGHQLAEGEHEAELQGLRRHRPDRWQPPASWRDARDRSAGSTSGSGPSQPASVHPDPASNPGRTNLVIAVSSVGPNDHSSALYSDLSPVTGAQHRDPEYRGCPWDWPADWRWHSPTNWWVIRALLILSTPGCR